MKLYTPLENIDFYATTNYTNIELNLSSNIRPIKMENIIQQNDISETQIC